MRILLKSRDNTLWQFKESNTPPLLVRQKHQLLTSNHTTFLYNQIGLDVRNNTYLEIKGEEVFVCYDITMEAQTVIL